jgi:hypothetical protein
MTTSSRVKVPPEIRAEFEAWLDDYVTALVAGLDDHFASLDPGEQRAGQGRTTEKATAAR